MEVTAQFYKKMIFFLHFPIFLNFFNLIIPLNLIQVLSKVTGLFCLNCRLFWDTLYVINHKYLLFYKTFVTHLSNLLSNTSLNVIAQKKSMVSAHFLGAPIEAWCLQRIRCPKKLLWVRYPHSANNVFANGQCSGWIHIHKFEPFGCIETVLFAHFWRKKWFLFDTLFSLD